MSCYSDLRFNNFSKNQKRGSWRIRAPCRFCNAWANHKAQSLSILFQMHIRATNSTGCDWSARCKLLRAHCHETPVFHSPRRKPSSWHQSGLHLFVLQRLANSYNGFGISVMQCLASIIVVGIVMPFFLIFVLPIGVIYYLLQLFYLTTSRSVHKPYSHPIDLNVENRITSRQDIEHSARKV